MTGHATAGTYVCQRCGKKTDVRLFGGCPYCGGPLKETISVGIVTMTPARYAELLRAEQERDQLAAEWTVKDSMLTLAMQQIDELTVEIIDLRQALAFYADLNAYYDEYGHTDLSSGDAGKRARAALAKETA